MQWERVFINLLQQLLDMSMLKGAVIRPQYRVVNLKSNRYLCALPLDVTIRVKSVLYVQIPINYP